MTLAPSLMIMVPAPEPGQAAVPRWLERWHRELRAVPLAEVVVDPATTAIFVVDLVTGLCTEGPWSSRRVGDVADPVADLLTAAHERGVRDIVLIQDTHEPRALEFAAYPRHCTAGSPEATTVPEVQRLPFASSFTTIPKNSLHPAIGTGFSRWLAEHPNLRTAVVVGVGTDLAVYQTAMHLRLRANALNVPDLRVVVPADAVETYHLSVQGAQMEGLLPHPGDFFQRVFLYHLALNGVEVVRCLERETGR